jgi:hypothetical protein
MFRSSYVILGGASQLLQGLSAVFFQAGSFFEKGAKLLIKLSASFLALLSQPHGARAAASSVDIALAAMRKDHIYM